VATEWLTIDGTATGAVIALAGEVVGGRPDHGPDAWATNPGTQINPLLDNFEGMAVDRGGPDGHGSADLALISDDNFGAGQVTRLLRVRIRLP
jgi:hypothetical protein